MSLCYSRNNELIIVRKQWHLFHRSALTEFYRLLAAPLTTEDNDNRAERWTLAPSAPLCLTLLLRPRVSIIRWCSPLIPPLAFLSGHLSLSIVRLIYTHTQSLAHRRGDAGYWIIHTPGRECHHQTRSSLHSHVFIYRLYGRSTKAAARIVSCPFLESK